jgi:hypothetical protein
MNVYVDVSIYFFLTMMAGATPMTHRVDDLNCGALENTKWHRQNFQGKQVDAKGLDNGPGTRSKHDEHDNTRGTTVQ